MTLTIGVWAQPVDQPGLDFVVEAERLGVDSAWVPEFWGYDALTPIAAAAAVTDRIKLASGIVQLGTRTPAMLAMTAMSLQRISNGRFILGLGTSGPQVMEGWHGVPFAKPVTRTRETIEIIRTITSGERLEYDGDIYQLPLPQGQGRALRSAVPPVDVPIFIASLGPKNLHLTGELTQGWIGNSFFCATADIFFDGLRAGAESAGRSLSDLDLSVSVGVEITDDVEEAARRHAEGFAFTFGAMGSASTNFYNDAFARQGWGAAVAEVQRLWLAGDRRSSCPHRDRPSAEPHRPPRRDQTPTPRVPRLRCHHPAPRPRRRHPRRTPGCSRPTHGPRHRSQRRTCPLGPRPAGL